MTWFFAPKPSRPRLTDAQKARSAAQFLARHRQTEVVRKSVVTLALEAFVAGGGHVSITPRESNIANIRRASR